MSFVTRVNADDVSYEYDVSPDGPSHLQKAIGIVINFLKFVKIWQLSVKDFRCL